MNKQDWLLCVVSLSLFSLNLEKKPQTKKKKSWKKFLSFLYNSHYSSSYLVVLNISAIINREVFWTQSS